MPTAQQSSATPTPAPTKPCAVLIDGSALYLATASRATESRRLNYFALVEVLVREFGVRPPSDNGSSIWTMWTSADPGNAGQSKFLDFAEQRLRWQVRSMYPSQAYMIEPETMFGIGVDSTKSGRLLRFDAQIAFAMGRLAESHRLVVVSDSFPLRDAMLRVNENWARTTEGCGRAFFGQSSETRWLTTRHTDFDAPFLDLDRFHDELFGGEPREEEKRPVQRPGHPVF
jgi:hypothetical protein